MSKGNGKGKPLQEGPPERSDAEALVPAPTDGRVAVNGGVARHRKHARKKLIFRWLMEGMPVPAIIDKGMREWKAGSRTVERYVSEVRKDWLPRLYDLADVETALLEEVARSEMLFARCVQSGDMRAAVAARRWLGELRGLTKEQRMKGTADMLRDEIRKLREAQGKHDGDDSTKAGLSLEAFNSSRRMYNQAEWPRELWDLYHAQKGVLTHEQVAQWRHLLYAQGAPS